MHNYVGGKEALIHGVISLLLGISLWFRDIIRESTYEDKHTPIVKRGLNKAMELVILSESMFFFALFWAFLHTTFAPAIQVGSLWPPKATPLVDPKGIPAANSGVLLASAITATLAQSSVKRKMYNYGTIFLFSTTVLSVFFLYYQLEEYSSAPFRVSDSAYGSCFYMLTGCHGFHVFLGTIAIVVAGFRNILGHFTSKDMLGLRLTILYWHFVDIVWVVVFVVIYDWGNRISLHFRAMGF